MFAITHATLNQQGETKSENPIKKYFKNQSITNKSSTEAKRNKNLALVSSISLIIAFILSVSPANGNTMATTESGTRVAVTNKSNAVSFNLCAYHFNFEQRMIINGQLMMVLTQFPYAPGQYDLTLVGTCDGYNLYDLSSGNSLTIDFPNSSTANDAENTSTEVSKPAPIQLVTGQKQANYLWIRKKK